MFKFDIDKYRVEEFGLDPLSGQILMITTYVKHGNVRVDPVRVQVDKLAAVFEAQSSQAWCVKRPAGEGWAFFLKEVLP